jgi:hypothetical protein
MQKRRDWPFATFQNQTLNGRFWGNCRQLVRTVAEWLGRS